MSSSVQTIQENYPYSIKTEECKSIAEKAASKFVKNKYTNEFEEAVSVAYLGIAKALIKLDKTRTPYECSAFIYRAAVWELKNERRAASKKLVTDSICVMSEELAVEEDYQLDNDEIINKAINRLSPLLKTIYVLTRRDGYSLSELSRKLGYCKKSLESEIKTATQKINNYVKLNKNGRKVNRNPPIAALAALGARSKEEKEHHKEKLREGASRHRRETKLANWLMKTPEKSKTNCWYFVEENKLYGPANSLTNLYKAIGVQIDIPIRGKEARKILASKTKIKAVPIRGHLIQELLDSGYELVRLEVLNGN